MSEENLRRNLLLRRFRTRVLEIIQRQKFISFHINRLECGDPQAREDFRFIQKSYRRALNLSTEQVRAYMKLVDMDELQGFSTGLLTRPVDSEDDEESTDDDADNNIGSQHLGGAEPLPEEGSIAREDFIDLCQADQEIMQRFGFKSRDELESYLYKNVPTYSPPSLAIPIEAPRIQGAQQDEAEAKEYDENGFYLGGYNDDEEMIDRDDYYDGDTDMGDDDDDNDKDEEKREETEEGDKIMEEFDAAVPTRSHPVSWADEVAEAKESEFTSSTNSTSASSSSTDPSSSEEPTVSSIELLNLDPFLRLSYLPSSEGSGRQNRPLSEGLRRVLLEIGGNPKTARSKKVTSLTQYEFDVTRGDWERVVADSKRQEDGKTLRRHSESWEETDLLDSWDENHCQFYWQTEGLFLCRLTELVYKDTFELARKALLASRNAVKVYYQTGGKREKPRRSSLRNQFPM
ncbi:hypothetical protein E0Z10_g10955 [Xylaria hypoxylon]|uniref:Uncharacterized protein n=1 Tax=Xylaria hypoxylon TaxID=37992 RepID=A0A4Z0Y8B5_9PEZI|nr:hypothetical protein E0Z10_g10955 [Xylaria hypoxylon]